MRKQAIMRCTEAVDSGEAANEEENGEDEEDIGEAVFNLVSACTRRWRVWTYTAYTARSATIRP